MSVGRSAATPFWLAGPGAHAANEKPAVFQLHRRHVIEVLSRFAGYVAQLEADAGAKVAEFALAGLGIGLRQQVEQAEVVQFQSERPGWPRHF